MNKMEEADPNESAFVVFRVGPDEDIVEADKNLLMKNSDVFRAMLSGPLAEKGEIKIPDSSKDVFSHFIGYLQTRELYDPGEDVTDILYLAKKYDVEDLVEFCFSFLRDNLSPETAADILQLADTFDDEELFEDAIEVIVRDILKGNIPSSFTDLSLGWLNLVIRSQFFFEDDHYVTAAVSAWAEEECGRQCLQVNRENVSKVLGGKYVPELNKMSFFGKNFGWMYFTCNLDIILHGVICHGLRDLTVLHVEIFMPMKHNNCHIVQKDIEITSNPSDGERVILPLPEPLFLGKDRKYSLQIMPKKISAPSRFSVSQGALKFNVDKYKFSVSKAPVVLSHEVISGLVISDGTIWRENRARRLVANNPSLQARDTTLLGINRAL